MTKKDYIEFAKWFATQQPSYASEKLFHQGIVHFAGILQRDNNAFAFNKFTEAIMKILADKVLVNTVEFTDLGECDNRFCFCQV